jgi:AcrR family transcriptional regulator
MAKARKRPTLTREGLLNEALSMIDRDGADALSMRRLAARFGVTPMALYRHVGGKRDLLHAVAGMVVDRIAYPIEGGDWRSSVAGCFQALRATCLRHPGVVPLIEQADALPASIFRPMEIVLAALRDAGLGEQDAVRAYFLLTTFTIGQVSYQTRGWATGVDAAEAARHGRLDADAFPNAARAAPRQEWDFDASFAFGLSVILSGLAGRIG